MRLIVVGAGAAGLALARSLRRRGLDPVVLDRGAPGAWEIAPRDGGEPVALAAPFVRVMEILAEGVPVRHGVEVIGLLRDDGRVGGVRARGSGGEEEIAADLVVACDGIRSPLRAMAGIDARLELLEGAHLSFITDALVDRSFALHYQADGRQVGLLGWPSGSAGWWDIDRSSPEAVRAPGLDAFRRAFARLIPAAEPALAALTSVDQLVYREITEVRTDRWWVPGLVVIGDAAHAVGPEAGLGAGLGLGDAHALAIAVERSGGDPDRACADYEAWRRPAVDPYLAMGAAGARIVRGGERSPWENWPPVLPPA